MTLKTGFSVVRVVRLQWGKSELAIQGLLCADLIHQLSLIKCLFYLLREGGWRWVWSGSSRGDGDFSKFLKVSVNIGDKFWHSQLGESNGEVLLNLVVDGPDHRNAAGDTLLSGGEGKKVSQLLVLEVGLVKGPEWGVNIEVAIEGDGKVRVMEVSGHVTEFFWEGGVCAEVVYVQEDIH